jgi:drug/metabolite transporter (DMT)-like permease
MSKRTLALISATIVSLIYGLTFTVAKDVMPLYINAYGFIVMRVFGATVLFWIVSFFMTFFRKKHNDEHLKKEDFPRLIACAFFGVAVNMLAFFKGLSYTSPISASVLMVSTPIIVLILSSILLKEKMLKRKISGIILGLVGTAFLILYGKSAGNAPNASMGNFLIFINAVSYGFYLIIVRKLMDKYNAFLFVKWIYLFGFLMVLPFGWNEFVAINWTIIPTNMYWKIGFIVIFSTFFTYLLNLLSMRELKPTTVAVFIYLQPVFATIFAIGLGKDELNFVKVIAAILIFVGVFLVTVSPRATQQKNE